MNAICSYLTVYWPQAKFANSVYFWPAKGVVQQCDIDSSAFIRPRNMLATA